MKKFYFLIFPIILLLLLGFLFEEEVKSGTDDNVSGWAWSENIGWISFNSTTGGGAVDYGVNILDTGIFSGISWSENIGWISFNRTDTGAPPAAPDYGTYLAKVDLGTGDVSGWARALAYGDGWSGWIKLKGSNYGVSIDRTSGDFSGWAWSDMVIGWISFNNLTGGGDKDYKVRTSFVFPPSVSNPHESWENVCDDSLHPTLNWHYEDGITDGYQVQIATDIGFSNIILDLISEKDSTSYIPLSSDFITDLQYGGIPYYWHVKAKNKGGAWSDWSDVDTFTTQLHAWPKPDFEWFPQSPSVNEVVQFCSVYEEEDCEEPPCPAICPENLTICYDSCPASGYTWIFGDESSLSGVKNPTHSYSNPVNYTIILEVTDSAGYYCSTDPNDLKFRITVELPLPEWKEIPPF